MKNEICKENLHKNFCPRNFCDKCEPTESLGRGFVTRFLTVEQGEQVAEKCFFYRYVYLTNLSDFRYNGTEIFK